MAAKHGGEHARFSPYENAPNLAPVGPTNSYPPHLGAIRGARADQPFLPRNIACTPSRSRERRDIRVGIEPTLEILILVIGDLVGNDRLVGTREDHLPARVQTAELVVP